MTGRSDGLEPLDAGGQPQEQPHPADDQGAGDLGSTLAWLEERRTSSRLVVRRVELPDCRDWSLTDGELRHRSGRYFQVTGAQVSTGEYAGWSRPMIRQHEVALMAFIVSRGQPGVDVKWLVQAKTEPGNVGGTQLAPTVQATRSNQDRVHGGSPTRFLEMFAGGAPDSDNRQVLTDVLASEQGTRFLGKRNRNMIVSLDPDAAPPATDAWRWLDRSTMRRMLVRDLTLNTDARSVIASGPWRLLADGSLPFAAGATLGEAGGQLTSSYEASSDAGAVLEELARRRSETKSRVEEVPLDWESGWRMADSRERLDGELALVDVEVLDREIGSWCQPLLASDMVEDCDLYAQLHDGIMRFLFRFTAEPGLANLVELGPTVQTERGTTYGAAPSDVGDVRLSVLQSDEGSRFLECIARYRIIEVRPDVTLSTSDAVWLTLSQIEALASQSGVFTNEARSVIALLLSEA